MQRNPHSRRGGKPAPLINEQPREKPREQPREKPRTSPRRGNVRKKFAQLWSLKRESDLPVLIYYRVLGDGRRMLQIERVVELSP